MFLLNVLLALVWTALVGQFGPASFSSGFVLSYLVLWLVRDSVGAPTYFEKVRNILGFALFFLGELIRANLRVAFEVITPPNHMRPGIVAIPLDLESDVAITLLATLLALTPGSLSLDVSADRRVLYVHAMHIHDLEKLRRDVKEGFERRVKEILQ